MKWSLILRLVFVGVVVIAAVAISVAIDLPTALRELLDWVHARGLAGAAVFVGVYVLATVFFVPGSILTLGAGFVYGVLSGTVLVSVASTLGALAAFLTGRYIARDWITARTAGNPRFRAIDQAVGREGWKIVFLTRLSPIFPYNLLNYAYGLTGVRAGAYFLASWIGMLPGTIMYVYFGSMAASIATIGAGDSRGVVHWVMYGVGFVATVGVTVFVTRLARHALTRSLQEATE